MLRNWIFLIFLLSLTLSLSKKTKRPTPAKAKPPTQQTFNLSALETPVIFSVQLKCRSNTTVTFNFDPAILDKSSLMLRLDYLPNRCIRTQQDLPIISEQQEVTF